MSLEATASPSSVRERAPSYGVQNRCPTTPTMTALREKISNPSSEVGNLESEGSVLEAILGDESRIEEPSSMQNLAL